MLNAIAFSGILMAWVSLCWVPFLILRAILGEGVVQKWSIISLFLMVLAVLGYTRTVARGGQVDAIIWSLFWLIPLGITFVIWSRFNPPLARFDKWLLAATLFFFLLVLQAMPFYLHALSRIIW